MQIEHGDWRINDQHKEWPWCGVNIQNGQVVGPFVSFNEAIAYIDYGKLADVNLEPFSQYNLKQIMSVHGYLTGRLWGMGLLSPVDYEKISAIISSSSREYMEKLGTPVQNPRRG